MSSAGELSLREYLDIRGEIAEILDFYVNETNQAEALLNAGLIDIEAVRARLGS